MFNLTSLLPFCVFNQTYYGLVAFQLLFVNVQPSICSSVVSEVVHGVTGGEVFNNVLESNACFPSPPKTVLLGIKIFHYEPNTFIRIPLNVYTNTACCYIAKGQILHPINPFYHSSTISLHVSTYLVRQKFSEVQVLDIGYKHKNKEKKEKNSENLDKSSF